MAFPTLNMLSFWVTFVSMMVMVAALFVTGGAPISGWTAYAPLSAVGQIAGPGLGTGQTMWIISIAIFLRGLAVRCLEFHYYRAQYAGQRNVFDAHALDCLGLVYNCHSGFAFLPGIVGCRDLAFVGSTGRNQFFHSRRPCH